ncbi:MAG: hypothetical protein KDI09_20115 [Halioglobus sp.]|nr:hypothetical protein [Halioglobus sp.]
MDITWLKVFADRWCTQEQQGRAPHAVLLLGAPGVGKRAAATWLAKRKLHPVSAGDCPRYPVELPQHPDLHWLTRRDDKRSIGIDQIRYLIGELSLTSHESRGKVAVIDPANIMTTQAANGLLKTLEEPPGDALIVLIADRMSRLPATILSRCQRITIALPEGQSSITWLDQVLPGKYWPNALREAGGGPLAALAIAERLDDAAVLSRDLKELCSRAASPIDVAERWHRQYPDLALDWLGRQVQACILRLNGQDRFATDSSIGDSVLQRMDSRNLFCYLDTINRLRGQASGSYNLQLTLEGLLIDWAEGLANCRGRESDSGPWPLTASR